MLLQVTYAVTANQKQRVGLTRERHELVLENDIPYSLKRSILLDISRGLFYLHGHSPPIIHRDLTARNILFTLSMQAKIADLGNARMVEPHRLNKTMSTAPGTLVYMPPETIRVQPRYDAKLDMFSFGHLSLYTAIHEFPNDLLPSTYPDPSNADNVKGRSEVQRREPYMTKLYKEFGKEHPLVKLIRQCLHNAPQSRPSAEKAMEVLEGLEVEKEVEDPYIVYEGMNRLDMVRLMLKEKEEVEGPPPPPLPPPPPKLSARRSSPAMFQAEDSLQMRVEQIQRGTPSMMAKYGSGMIKWWKPYIFKITNNTYVQYLDKTTDKLHGELLLSSVTLVDIPPPIKGAKFPFAVHFSHKGSPWIINAFSEEERKSWMEAIRPGSTSEPQVPKHPYGAIPDDLFEEEIYEEPEPMFGTAEEFEVYDDVAPFPCPPPFPSVPPAHADDDYEHIYDTPTPDPPQPPRKELYVNLKSDFYAYFDPDEQPAAEDPTKQISMSESGYLSLLTRDHTDEDSYMGLIYDVPPELSQTLKPPVPPKPSQPPKPPIAPKPRLPPPPVQPPPPVAKKHVPPKPSRPPKPPIAPKPRLPPPPVQPPPPVAKEHVPPKPSRPPKPPIAPKPRLPPPPVQPPPPVAKEHSSLAWRVLQHLDPAQVDIMIKMLQQLKDESTSAAVPSPVPMKMDDGLYEDISFERELPLPPDRPVPGKQNKADPFRMSPLGHKPAKESNFKLLLKKSRTVTSDRMLIVEDEEEEYLYEPRPEWAKATTLSEATPSSLSALQQEALYISRSALSGLEPIGEGQFGKVYKANLKRDVKQIKVAIKTIRRYTSEKETQDFMREMNIMADMMHPNIIRLYGLVNEDPDVSAPWMVLEYLPYGDLKHFLNTYSRPVEQLVKYMIDVAMGMHYLAEKGLVHRDLAARNVIVGENELCKVADFGLLRELPPDDKIYHSQSKGLCPIRWMAPESIRSRAFSTASDVWSFGILQWEMFYPDRLPYQNMENMECAVNVARGYRLPLPRKSPSIVRRVMKACWHHNPIKRPSFLLISTLLSTRDLSDC